MLTLPSDRALNVCQARMLEEAVVEKEVYEAREKAKAQMAKILSGDNGLMYDALELPLDDGENEGVGMPAMQSNLPALPPPLTPTDDDFNPFPGLERPLGQ